MAKPSKVHDSHPEQYFLPNAHLLLNPRVKLVAFKLVSILIIFPETFKVFDFSQVKILCLSTE